MRNLFLACVCGALLAAGCGGNSSTPTTPSDVRSATLSSSSPSGTPASGGTSNNGSPGAGDNSGHQGNGGSDAGATPPATTPPPTMTPPPSTTPPTTEPEPNHPEPPEAQPEPEPEPEHGDDVPGGEQETEAKGTLGPITGACPAISSKVGSTKVTTSQATRFDDAACTAFKAGDKVEVDGVKQADGSIAATRLRKK